MTHIVKRVMWVSRLWRGQLVKFPGNASNVPGSFEQADPFGRLKDQVTTIPAEEWPRNWRGVDFRPRNVMNFEIEEAQCGLELSPDYLIGIMLPAGRKRWRALMTMRPDRRTQKNLCRVRQLSNGRIGPLLNYRRAALMMNEQKRPILLGSGAVGQHETGASA
jgi:hypothetical protein